MKIKTGVRKPCLFTESLESEVPHPFVNIIKTPISEGEVLYAYNDLYNLKG